MLFPKTRNANVGRWKERATDYWEIGYLGGFFSWPVILCMWEGFADLARKEWV